jgi:hypothetical protein
MSREQKMVPRADFRSYYGRQIVKTPVWRRDIAAYLFAGGLAAGSSLLAAGADLAGQPALRRAGRLTSLAALGASTYFLINDLGRPKRFLNMLRVAKPTSPMSTGTWILAAFAPAAGLAAISEFSTVLPEHGVPGLLRRALPGAGTVAGIGAAALAPALGTYTAVLLADTATPAWHAARDHLPFLFGGSALASAGGVGLVAAPLSQAGPARRLAVTGAALELAAARRIEHGLGLLSEPYTRGRAGRLLRLSRALTSAGALGALTGRRSRALSALAGAALLAGSVATRFGVFEAGKASTVDPRYVVEPQRERLAERERLAQRTTSVTPARASTSSPTTG